jgi:hypothetical protein
MITINLGDVFDLNTYPHGHHFFVAIAKSPEDLYLFVSFSTFKEGKNQDESCLIYPGEDSVDCVRHKSFVSYQHSKVYSPKHLTVIIIEEYFRGRAREFAEIKELIRSCGDANARPSIPPNWNEAILKIINLIGYDEAYKIVMKSQKGTFPEHTLKRIQLGGSAPERMKEGHYKRLKPYREL